MYQPYTKETANTTDRIAWALCQIIDDDAPMRWTRYRFAAECIAKNPEVMADLHKLGRQPQPGRVEGWQPIETAPHGDVGPDDDRVAILVRTNYDIRVEDARFVDTMRNAAVEDGEQCVFTHWMPIPEMPTAGGDA